jgi:hypothetical protein
MAGQLLMRKATLLLHRLITVSLQMRRSRVQIP